MDKNPKYIGRIVFFKYISITIFIILGMTSASMYLSIELEDYFYKRLINPFFKNSIFFSIVIVLGFLITYLVAGKVGKSIIVRKESPFLTTFLGFYKNMVRNRFLCISC